MNSNKKNNPNIAKRAGEDSDDDDYLPPPSGLGKKGMPGGGKCATGLN